MQNHNSIRSVFRFLQHPACLLCSIWLGGLAFGVFTAAGLDDTYFHLMLPFDSHGLSIFRQLAVVYLPFLFAAYAVSIDQTKLLLVLCFLKAFVFSFCGYLIFRMFGSAGWLVRFLLLFTDVFTIPALFWFCIRHVEGQILNAKRDLIICILLATMVVCIDYFAVSPFTAELIDYTMGRFAYSCWI